MSDTGVLVFEGIEVKPVKGVYKCPYNCHDKRYPAKKWKTEKGFINHMDDCYMRPSEVAKRADAEEKRSAEDDLKKADLQKEGLVKIKESGLQIGQKMFYVYRYETKPTHVQRGNRLVKVRYEAEYAYRSACDTIKSIQYNGSIVINGGVREFELMPSMSEAEAKAKESNDSHQQWLKECSNLR